MEEKNAQGERYLLKHSATICCKQTYTVKYFHLKGKLVFALVLSFDQIWHLF